jgi:hypothetical protein
MYQSYVLFKTDQGNIDSASENILFHSSKFVKHIMNLYKEGGILVRFVAPKKSLIETHINSLRLASFGILETRILYSPKKVY